MKKADLNPFEELENSINLVARHKYQKALEAIKARINGEWDNPALLSYGDLSTNETEDILRIIDET